MNFKTELSNTNQELLTELGVRIEDRNYSAEEIKRCEGTQFDPQIAEVFIEILNNDFDKIKEIQEKY